MAEKLTSPLVIDSSPVYVPTHSDLVKMSDGQSLTSWGGYNLTD